MHVIKSKKWSIIALLIILLIGALFALYSWYSNQADPLAKNKIDSSAEVDVLYANPRFQLATFAGGCFWCMEPPFEKLEGVKAVISGYAGGEEVNPTYEDVAAGKTGHYESVQVIFDPNVIRYEDLLQVFWRQIDPTDNGGQFVDRGTPYLSAIFYHNEEQKKLASQSLDLMNASKRFAKPIVTEILPATSFYRAEEYHQDYYLKNPMRYKYYRNGSGRDQYLEQTWGSEREYSFVPQLKSYEVIDKEAILSKLTPLQYAVTQQDDTEPPFQNEYWDHQEQGIYVDIVSREPLFSSLDKYDSGTGWPSFTKPLDESYLVTKEDRSLLGLRIEVRSKYGDSHLGHVFDDGPPPTGLRYCMNSAALQFIPKEKLIENGYEKYAPLFK
jgi:peptide methionine sulfoxide reductase msrA/msrB